MSATNFGVNSAPVGTTVTTPYVNPVIPTPIPSAGAAKGFISRPSLKDRREISGSVPGGSLRYERKVSADRS